MEIVINDKELLFMRVTREEALRLITSLSKQMSANNPNVGREEMWAKCVNVSIAVIPDE